MDVLVAAATGQALDNKNASIFEEQKMKENKMNNSVDTEKAQTTSELNLRLHDCLALGEVVLGLTDQLSSTPESSSFGENKVTDESSTYPNHPLLDSDEDVVNRLPLLLRLLQSSRPLSSIPTFRTSNNQMNNVCHDNIEEEDNEEEDPVIGEAVARLEDRAARYGVAEGVQVVACHLAPAVTKSVCRLPPLSRLKSKQNLTLTRTENNIQRGGLEVVYDTTQLEELGEKIGTSVASTKIRTSNQGGKERKRKRLNPEENQDGDVTDDYFVVSDNELDLSTTIEGANSNYNNNKTSGTKRSREYLAATAIDHSATSFEDSQEFAIVKTLQELIRLTVQSLKQSPSCSTSTLFTTTNDVNATAIEDEGEAGGTTTLSDGDGSVNSSLAITVLQDSILAEAARSNQHQHQTGTLCDLASTVASLMYYTPVLRHRHVASALCRAAFTQTPDLISRMGANCPAAVPLLASGCLDVYRYAMMHKTIQEQRRHNHHTIAAICKQAVRKLAKLSPKESYRIQKKLRDEGVMMMDVQLEISMENDPLAAACLVIDHLSSSTKTTNNNEFSQASSTVGKHHSQTSNLPSISSHIGRRRRHSDAAMITMPSSVSAVPPKCVVRSLQDHLIEKPELLAKTLRFFCTQWTQFGEISRENKVHTRPIPWGKVCLLLRAYIWVLHKVPVCGILIQAETKIDFSELISVTVKGLSFLTNQLRKQVSQNCSEFAVCLESTLDRPYSCLLSANLLTWVALFPVSSFNEKISLMKSFEGNEELRTKTWSILTYSLNFPTVSNKSTSLAFLLMNALKEANFASLTHVLEKALFIDSKACHGTMCLTKLDYTFLCEQFLKASSWMTSGCFKFESNPDPSPTTLDPSVMISILVSEHASDKEKFQCAECSLKAVLAMSSNRSREEILQILRHPSIIPFFLVACRCLYQSCNINRVKIPLVLPVQIEQVSTNLELHNGLIKLNERDGFVFLMQLLYCFFFSEMVPDSPFKFDPLLLPLKEVYAVCEIPGFAEPISNTFRAKIRRLIDRHCPEIRVRARRLLITRELRQRFIISSAGDIKFMSVYCKRLLVRLIRRSISQQTSDPSGLLAEKLFSIADGCISDHELATVTTSALLSTPSSPAMFFTYPMLYRDPLTILKCSMTVWNRPGLRRIALAVLASLLETNERIVSQAAPTIECQLEFLHSRNEIVLRSMVKISASASNASEIGPLCCPTMHGLVRKIISSRPGLGAMLFKHGLTENEIDWLVEVIPEMMGDAQCFSGLISDRFSTTAAERLVTADGLVRLAVVHGYQNDVFAESLIQLALAQLINSFFLIIGPGGGVPMNLFSSTEGTGGIDVVQVSRKAAFRILKMLQKVRLYRTRFKNECALSLQRMAGLCRGEIIVGTSPSAITNRQKGLLKELLDAVTKAADSMGVVLQTS